MRQPPGLQIIELLNVLENISSLPNTLNVDSNIFYSAILHLILKEILSGNTPGNHVLTTISWQGMLYLLVQA